jgi:outer membrane protein assembly factor BamD (BamD/ComL family)/predicted small secreted protein
MRISLALLSACLLLTACRTTSGPDFGAAGEALRGNDTLQLPGQYAGGGGVPGGTGVRDAAPPPSAQQVQALEARRLEQARALWQRAESAQSPAQKAGLYEAIADGYPEFPNAAEARYRQGRNEYLAHAYMDSVRTLEEYMQIAPVNPHLGDIEEMIYDSGVRYIRNKGGFFANIFKTDEDGLNALRYVAASFPAGDYADDALLFLGNYYRDDQEPDTAVLMYKELLMRYPDSEWSFEARKGLASTYAARDQGPPYNAGFVDRDPREDVPDDPRAEAHAGPVKSSLELAIGQYDRFIERIDRDPGRCGEYTLQVDEVKRQRQIAREKLALKDDRVAAYYAKRGDKNAALVYRRSAARWRGDESISCLPLDLTDPSAVPGVAPVVPTQPGMPVSATTSSGQLIRGAGPGSGRSSIPAPTVGQDPQRRGSQTYLPDLSRSAVPPPAYDMPTPGVPQDFSGSSTLPPPPPPPNWAEQR